MPPQTASRHRVAIYARQSEDVDQGIVQQLDDCRKEAVRRNWRVVAEFRDNDTGASKARGPKTDWFKMLHEFDAGTFDVLLVTETSRLTRSLTDVLDVCPPRRDIRVVVIREGIDTDIDDFMLKQLVLLAEREVKIKAARAARYAAERRKEGHPGAGLTPHGYRWVPAANRDRSRTRYLVDETEAADVRTIFAEFLAGASLGQIARDLNAAGSSTRRGARWRSDIVRRILMNPFYAALLPPAQPTGKHSLANIDLDACAPGAWEAIVGLEQLIAARGRLVGVKPNHRGTARRWLLSGLAICSVCREPVRSARGRTHPTARKDGTGKAPSKLYHTYRCVNGHFMRNGDVIDNYVSAVCIARLSEPDALSLLVPSSDGTNISVLHDRRDALRASRKNVFKLIDDDPARLADAEERLNDLEQQLRALDEEITSVTSRNAFADLIGVDDVRAWWDSATLARRRAVVGFLLSVSIRPIGKGRRVASWEAVAESVQLTPKD